MSEAKPENNNFKAIYLFPYVESADVICAENLVHSII